MNTLSTNISKIRIIRMKKPLPIVIVSKNKYLDSYEDEEVYAALALIDLKNRRYTYIRKACDYHRQRHQRCECV